jgi:hypothetical protein
MMHMFNDMFYFHQPVFVPVVVVREQSKLQQAAPSQSPPAPPHK